MKKIGLKSVLGKSRFVGFGTMIRLTMWWIRPRRKRVFFIFEGREYTYGEVYRRSLELARFFALERERRADRGELPEDGRLCVGIYVDNVPEFIFAAFAAGLSNSILFAVNTGFRGETLVNVTGQSGISMLIVNSSTVTEVERVRDEINLPCEDILYAGPASEVEGRGYGLLDKAVEAAARKGGKPRAPRVELFSPVLVIYTSGTTGLPKGVPCTHAKMIGAGFVVESAVRLTKRDRGYIAMPLFHANDWYIGILPQMIVGGSFVLKRRFSAGAFEGDMLEYGVTFLNYVGQPLHYIISALEKKYGSGEAVEEALARHPRNRFRAAYGNGASVVDREKIERYLNMDHVYEIYGSAEAVVTTVNRPGDPFDSLGRCPKSVAILDSEDEECEPGIAGDDGRLTNYDRAVGEICRRVGENNLRFGGYFGNAEATRLKFRGGVFHSGDLGHVRIFNGRKYLYFNGRTDDWIRKDGENFSAENVLDYAKNIPGVNLAIAYGCPCDVSDEKVMIAVQMKEGREFDPDGTFAWLTGQREESGMDPKWMPDFIRVVESFPLTDTHKIIVRPYKKEHFNIEDHPGMRVYYTERGDNTYAPLSAEKYRTMKERFIENGRGSLLKTG